MFKKQSEGLCNHFNEMRSEFCIIHCKGFREMFLSPHQWTSALPHQNLGWAVKTDLDWVWSLMSNNRSSTTCSMELIICAGFFSSPVLLIRGARPSYSNDVTVCPHFYLVGNCIVQKESCFWLTEMCNGSECTRGVHVVGGICSLLVSKAIISHCQWPAPVANMNQSRNSLQSERFSSVVNFIQLKNIKGLVHPQMKLCH